MAQNATNMYITNVAREEQRFHIGFRSLDAQEMKKKKKCSTKSVTMSSREMRWKQTYKREGGVARRSWGRGY